jgi:hypothetical protein
MEFVNKIDTNKIPIEHSPPEISDKEKYLINLIAEILAKNTIESNRIRKNIEPGSEQFQSAGTNGLYPTVLQQKSV